MPNAHLGVMTITFAVFGSILHAACMLWMVPGVKKSQLLSPTSTPCLSCRSLAEGQTRKKNSTKTKTKEKADSKKRISTLDNVSQQRKVQLVMALSRSVDTKGILHHPRAGRDTHARNTLDGWLDKRLRQVTRKVVPGI